MTDANSIVVLGAGGFIGSHVVREAVAAGLIVKAVVRSQHAAEALRDQGVSPIVGDAETPEAWIDEVAGAGAIIDLIQPHFPKRLSRGAIQTIVAYRLRVTSRVLDALQHVPNGRRPTYFSVSGVDDLQPDERGTISAASALRVKPYGFSRIGVPIRRLIERSQLATIFVYFGLVYGSGKIFKDVVVDRLRKGTATIIGTGRQRVPLTHVDDAARAISHLANQYKDIVGNKFLATDGTDVSLRQLYDFTADAMRVRRARTVPAWLASLVAGAVAVETITLDVHADPSALFATGFKPRYPSYREGVLATLSALMAMSQGRE